MPKDKHRNRIVFLDRDGTINFDPGYLTDPTKVQLIPGAGCAIAKLRACGFSIVVISNQAAIGKRLGTVEDVERVNEKIRALLSAEHGEAKLDEVLFCPHRADEGCDCRKPRTGLVTRELERWGLDGNWRSAVQNCWMVGDKEIDLEFGWNLGIPQRQTVLVETGHGCEARTNLERRNIPVRSFPSIVEVADFIISETSSGED